MRVALLIALAACGPKTTPPPPESRGSNADARPEIDKRRDVACERVGSKLTECAVADAKAELDAGRITRAAFDADTDPAIQRRLTAKFIKECRVPMSSRQVRVLEVCFKQEPECEPLADCLTHLNDHAPRK